MPAHAKLNLFLRVLAREADGYHSIETLFCLVTLADALRAERREGRGVTVEVLGTDPGPATENLAVRAATMVLDATGNRFAVHLVLEKKIPMGAGLGGGSSDAAAALAAREPPGGECGPASRTAAVRGQVGQRCSVFPERGAARSRLVARGTPAQAPATPICSCPAPIAAHHRSRQRKRTGGWMLRDSRNIGVARWLSTSTSSPAGAMSAGWRGTISSRRFSVEYRRSERASKLWSEPLRWCAA